MQLILETEPKIDIKKDMAKLNEPLDEKLITYGVSEEPKNDMFERNKESIKKSECQDDIIDCVETTAGDNNTAEESVTEEMTIDYKKHIDNNLVTDENTTSSSVENRDINITRTDDHPVENGSKKKEEKESHQAEKLYSNSVTEEVCEEKSINQDLDEFNENEVPEKVCSAEESENGVPNADTEENKFDSAPKMEREDKIERIITDNEKDEFKEEVIDEFEIDKISDEGGDIDINYIENELISDEEANVPNDVASVNSEIDKSINDVNNAEEVNVSNRTEEKQDSIMEISEISVSELSCDKCPSNDDTESGYGTAIPSVDDQQKINMEALSEEESKLLSNKLQKNLENEPMETDIETQDDNIKNLDQFTVESNDITQIPLTVKSINAGADLQDKAIDEDDNNMNLDQNIMESSNIDKDKNTISFDANTMESSNITQIPLTEESIKAGADASDKAIEEDDKIMNLDQSRMESSGVDEDDNIISLVQNTMESSEITQIPSSVESKKTAADIQDKVIDEIDDIVNLDQNAMESRQIPLTVKLKTTAAGVQEKALDEFDHIKMLDQNTKESSDITQIPLTDESKKTTADILDKAIDEDVNIKNLDQNIMESTRKTQITLIDESKQLTVDILDKIIDEDDNIKNLGQNTMESSDIIQMPLIEESNRSVDEHNKTRDEGNSTIDIEHENKGSGYIPQTTLIDDAKNMAVVIDEKVMVVDDNLKDLVQKTNNNVEDTALIEEVKLTQAKKSQEKDLVKKKKPSVICKLSNTLDILSDDEDEPTTEESDSRLKIASTEKQCIDIEDDDDVMLIDEDTDRKDSKIESPDSVLKKDLKENNNERKEITVSETAELISDSNIQDSTPNVQDINEQPHINEKPNEQIHKINALKPLLPENFLKSAKKNLFDMTRDDLEEFCILKIVESVVDRSNLNEIKTKLKNMTQTVKEYSNKAKMLSKQNRDLQVVMKSIQEEQKKRTDAPITPLKITRSVGMQVFMTDKVTPKRKVLPGANTTNANLNTVNKQVKPAPGQRPQRQVQVNNQNQIIPVPRLVPATPSNVTVKAPANQIPVTNQIKTSSPVTNGVKNTVPAQKSAEKRTHNRLQSVTVDLTDDEPPPKLATRSSSAHPVRVVPSQNLMAPQRPQFSQSNSNSPRKVYIPISGPQGQNLRPGQYMLKSVAPSSGPRPRGPTPQITRMPQNQVKVQRALANRHPGPLPDAMKQYQPPNWKSLPPSPDIKLSKVENGIVISWKIDGYDEDIHEEIASYQLYAYQETPSPPSTTLWKKIGDVKALPLPMACTLTQFMAGYKYFFAVRAVDVRSRLGPFSVPGSILLLNKM